MKTIDEILQMDFRGKNVVIIGSPASGKTFLASRLKEQCPEYSILHTDDYKEHGFEQSLYVLIEDLKTKQELNKPLIIEGILGFRLLRKGAELDSFYPDVVIDIAVDDEKIHQIYHDERDPSKLKGVLSLQKSCNTILSKYLALMQEKDSKHKPEWISCRNNY